MKVLGGFVQGYFKKIQDILKGAAIIWYQLTKVEIVVFWLVDMIWKLRIQQENLSLERKEDFL